MKPSLIFSSVNLRCSLLNARVIACNKENFVTLQVQVAVEHGYEMLSWATRTLNDLSLSDTVGCNSKSILDTLEAFG